MNSRRKFVKDVSVLSAATLFVSSFTIFENDIHTPIRAKRLKPGDAVAITSPAGAVWDQQQVDKFEGILKSFGFVVVRGKTLTKQFGYFSGTDEERANELNVFFSDEKIKGIFCMKGGWGSARILEYIDYNLIKTHPKVIIGFSDITTLLNVINEKTGLITFHGPVGNSGWNEFTSTVFKNLLIHNELIEFPFGPNPEDKIITFVPGQAKGALIGGNLSVIVSLLGTKYFKNWKNKILFLEETKEEPYRIDRMLTQLKLAGMFNELNGIILGKFVKCEAEEPKKAFTYMEIFEQHFKSLQIPVFYGAMIGHIENKLTLPIGVEVSMDSNSGKILLLKNAVI